VGGRGKGRGRKGKEGKRTSEPSPSSKFSTTPLSVFMEEEFQQRWSDTNKFQININETKNSYLFIYLFIYLK